MKKALLLLAALSLLVAAGSASAQPGDPGWTCIDRGDDDFGSAACIDGNDDLWICYRVGNTLWVCRASQTYPFNAE